MKSWLLRSGASLWSRPYTLLALTALMWGGNAVASRLAVGEITPFALTTLRWVLVCALLPLLLPRDWRQHGPALRPHLGFLIAMALFGFTGFNTLMYVAAHHTGAINLGILQGSIPVIVLLGSLLLYGTPVAALQILGVAITVVGVVIIASQGSMERLAGLQINPGDLGMMLACTLYALYTLGLKRRPPVPGLVFFSALAVLALAWSLPALIWEIASGAGHWPTGTGWLIVLYVGVFPSLVSQLTFMRGVELIGPGRAGIFVNTVPVFTGFLAVLVLGEVFQVYHALALALVLGGIYVAERAKRENTTGSG